MESFENKINEVFDFNISEEVEKFVIEEGMLDKALGLAKKAVSLGVEKVLPSEWLLFAQGLYAAAKQSPEAVAEFLSSTDQNKVKSLVNVVATGAPEKVGAAVKEGIDRGEAIEEGAEDVAADAMARHQEIGDAIQKGAEAASAGASAVEVIITVVLSVAFAYGLYRIIKAGVEIYRATQNRFNPKRNRR